MPPTTTEESLQAEPSVRLRTERDFLRLATARFVSVIGNGLVRVALAFGMLSLPHATPGRLSLVLTCQALPQVAFILVGGVIADRVRRSRLILASEYTAGCAYALMALLIVTRHAPLLLLCLLAVISGTASALLYPALEGLLPLLVPRSALQRANGALKTGTNIANLLGLGAAGSIVALAGAGWALAVNALSFLISGLLMQRIDLPRRPAPSNSSWADFRCGWREFRSRPWLWALTCQYALVMAAVNATAGVLGPLVFHTHDHGARGARDWSLLVASQAVGSIAGTILASRSRFKRPMLVANLAALPASLPMVLLAAAAPDPFTAAAMFLHGLSFSLYGVVWATTLQRHVPEATLSRVSSFDWLGSLSLATAGLLAAGPYAELTTPPTALVSCAILVVVATSLCTAVPQVRRFADRAR
ncbi:MFS transporter [Streptomyces sp. NPDC006335]|uniref:MFS transporter n=1 Tax=Streptomyces sp. NPDC006335 TaxID=3156895 RepID=UPI0033B47A6F